jgi:hypothetical protein
MRPLKKLLALCLVAATPAVAASDLASRLSERDQERLAAFDATRTQAVAAAEAGGSAADVATLSAVLDATPQPILGEDIRGDYRCRTMKLDGVVPLVVYGWFACRIEEDDTGYRLVKLTGSQRVSGHFIDESESRLIFWGTAHYADEAPMRYDVAGDRNVVGYFFKIGDGRYLLEQPLPATESRFDILELERR